MNYRQKELSRRELIKYIVLGASIPYVQGDAYKAEAATASKALMKYQDKQNGSEKCSNRILFIPGDTSDAKGECKVVAGSISPQGWCTVFSPKS